MESKLADAKKAEVWEALLLPVAECYLVDMIAALLDNSHSDTDFPETRLDELWGKGYLLPFIRILISAVRRFLRCRRH